MYVYNLEDFKERQLALSESVGSYLKELKAKEEKIKFPDDKKILFLLDQCVSGLRLAVFKDKDSKIGAVERFASVKKIFDSFERFGFDIKEKELVLDYLLKTELVPSYPTNEIDVNVFAKIAYLSGAFTVTSLREVFNEILINYNNKIKDKNDFVFSNMTDVEILDSRAKFLWKMSITLNTCNTLLSLLSLPMPLDSLAKEKEESDLVLISGLESEKALADLVLYFYESSVAFYKIAHNLKASKDSGFKNLSIAEVELNMNSIKRTIKLKDSISENCLISFLESQVLKGSCNLSSVPGNKGTSLKL